MIFTNHLPSRRLPAIGAGYRFCRFSTVVTVRRYFNFQKSLKWITGVFGLLFISEYLDDTRAGVYQLVPWLARLFDPEKCHEYAMLAAQLNILPKEHMKFPVSLQTNVMSFLLAPN